MLAAKGLNGPSCFLKKKKKIACTHNALRLSLLLFVRTPVRLSTRNPGQLIHSVTDSDVRSLHNLGGGRRRRSDFSARYARVSEDVTPTGLEFLTTRNRRGGIVGIRTLVCTRCPKKKRSNRTWVENGYRVRTALVQKN